MIDKTKLISVLLLCLLMPLNISYARSGVDLSGRLSLTMDKAIEMATANNSLITEAVEKQKAAMEEEKSVESDLYPKFSASYSYTNLKEQPFSRCSIGGLPQSSR
jgi:outer membrane protein TolC